MLVQEKGYFGIPLLTPDAQRLYCFDNCTFAYIASVTGAQAVVKGKNLENADMVTMGNTYKYYDVEMSVRQVCHLNRYYPKQLFFCTVAHKYCFYVINIEDR